MYEKNGTTYEMNGAELIHYMYEDMYGALGVLDILEQIIEMKKKGGDWVKQFEEQFECEDFEALCAELRGDISRYEKNRAEIEKRTEDLGVL